MTSLSPFELVTQNLLSIGALSIDDFLSSAHEPQQDVLPASSSSSAIPRATGVTAQKPTTEILYPERPSIPGVINGPRKSTGGSVTALAQLHQICLRQFGHAHHSLNFEFLEDAVDRKQCILTITRLDGAVRSYKTEPVFPRKSDAKAQAAVTAMEHGAMDFIMFGDSDQLKAKKGVLLAPLEDDQPVASTSKLPSDNTTPEPEPSLLRVKEVEACCQEWRGDGVKPHWLNFNDLAMKQHGAALKIQLAPHCYRVYSCEPSFNSPSDALEHCANVAIDEKVLEFIKHGNGQTAPRTDSTPSSVIPIGEKGVVPTLKSLQSFYESLPQPFEESFGDKTVEEINAPGWLSNALANAKGARFTSDFHPLVCPRDVSTQFFRLLTPLPTDLHGCLLRLGCPGECRSYLVEPVWCNLKDAKAAVVLLALSQGAGKWIREVAAAVEARITQEMRRFAQASLFPTIASETQRSKLTTAFESHRDGDAFGATLKLDLGKQGVRKFFVSAEYRSKQDARIAVAFLAAHEGLIDMLRGNGKVAPGQVPAFSCKDDVFHIIPNPIPKKPKNKKKRSKNDGDKQGPPTKKQKTASGSNTAIPLPKKPANVARIPLPPKPKSSTSGGSSRRVQYCQDAPSPAQNTVPTLRYASDPYARRSRSLEEGEVLDSDSD
ncbi:hypothetical protein C8R47DRAFT_981945 [Mycena vitilis]|nr:hypothetical protein C8R47DRAFT_981945 [Mycena vitilis]